MRTAHLLLLLLLTGFAHAQDSPLAKPKRGHVFAEIGLLRAGVGAEYGFSEKVRLAMSTGIGTNFLMGQTYYPAYKEYQNSGPPKYPNDGPDIGEFWTSLHLTADLKYYLLANSLYMGLRCRLTGPELGTQTETEIDGGLFSPTTKRTIISRYRNTYKTGLVIGFDGFTNRKESLRIGASTGFGFTCNHDFTYSRGSLLMEVSLSRSLARF